MKIIKNNIIPFRGFCAITFWPCVFVRKDCVDKLKKRGLWDTMINHESIHCCQQKEMLAAGACIAAVMFLAGFGFWSLLALPLFFWWYLLEWFIRLFGKKNAYRNISFEREAFANEDDETYTCDREPMSWFRYLIVRK